MSRSVVSLLILVWIGLADLSVAFSAENKEPLVQIHGNSLFNEETYRAILDLPPQTSATDETARIIRRKLLHFLHRAGYELAVVQVKAQGGHLEVEVDEGRLEKVVFVGASTLQTLELKINLNLPHHVFNRPNLERQLASLGKLYQLQGIWYKLIPVQPKDHHGPQLESLGKIQGDVVIPPVSRYELHIYLTGSDWNIGLGVSLNYDFPDGLDLGAYYQGQGLIFQDDRWLAGSTLGGKFRKKINGGDSYLALSRADLEVRWYTPALIGKGFRPFVWLRSDLTSRQRGDLGLEIYYDERLEGTLNLGYELIKGLMFSIGGGLEYKHMFGIEWAGVIDDSVEFGSWLRPFLLGRGELVFNTKEERRDRRHQLLLESRYYWVDQEQPFGRAGYAYQKVIAFGWHDLWIKSRGTVMWGQVPFDEEEPVGGRYLRGCFGDQYFVHHVVNLVLEFRFSLVRDVYKIGFFHDLAVFGQQNRTQQKEVARVANSFGLGFHTLVLDAIQADLFFSLGSASDGNFDYGLSAGLSKVF